MRIVKLVKKEMILYVINSVIEGIRTKKYAGYYLHKKNNKSSKM